MPNLDLRVQRSAGKAKNFEMPVYFKISLGAGGSLDRGDLL